MEDRTASRLSYKIYNINGSDYGNFIGAEFNSYDVADMIKESLIFVTGLKFVVRCEFKEENES